MKDSKNPKNLLILVIFVLWVFVRILPAQVTEQDYKRADRFANDLNDLVYHGDFVPHWIENTPRFWYRNQLKGGKEFIVVDADKILKRPAFDHQKLAASLSSATTKSYTAITLPFDDINFDLKANAVSFVADGFEWTCDLSTYACKRGVRSALLSSPPGPRASRERRSEEVKSPDGQWFAFTRDFNVRLRSVKTGEEFELTRDGSEAHYYGPAVVWSPDSQRLATYFIDRGRETTVYLIESAPQDQFRPIMTSRPYTLPGDVLSRRRACVLSIKNQPAIKVKEDVAENGFVDMNYPRTDIEWSGDSRFIFFPFQGRGEQLARIYRVNADTGAAGIVLEETAGTFIDRYNLFVRQINDGREIIWSSERDGWRHLYRYDTDKASLVNQVTKGSWVVRGIDYADDKNQQLFFTGSGREDGEDPYFIHYYRIQYDGTNLTSLTPEVGSHTAFFSQDHRYYVDIYSRVDAPPVSVLRRTSDARIVMELEKADISDLLKTGWKMPEPFVAKARDGKTDIYGVIYRPSNFDPSKSYPIIENIYAGPHGSFVPKTFRAARADQAMAELGFIVVQMDGMGTANRSRTFHDIAWKNIADAGFPDRILWIKAAAKKYPYMDIQRVGIFGHSAGGQNSLAALLFHPEFYKVAVSSCGCHDNRLDKAIWNEQWMGLLGPHYAEQSNVTNAHKLKGKLMLIVGEMDTNVPPQSTLKVVDALIKAGKDFDLLVVPGMGHSPGGAYGERRRRDFFVKNLLGQNPPDWNTLDAAIGMSVR